MPSEEYTAVSGGALKLKGVNPASKIHKQRKKKPKPATTEVRTPKIDDPTNADTEGQDHPPEDDDDGKAHEPAHLEGDSPKVEDSTAGKTEAERHYQEMRKKRVNERLKKEGTKTHKQRVEELNRYLNKLSEHHDMPKIGPG